MQGRMTNMAVLALLVALAACGGGGGSSPEPSAAPAPAASPTGAPGTGVSTAPGPAAATGWRADADFVVNSASSANAQVMPAVAGLAGGGHVVVWTGATGDSVTMRRYDVHGMPLGAESVLDGGRAGVHPTVVAMPDGGFAVAWFQFPGFGAASGVDNGFRPVIVQRFDADGAATMPATLAGTSWNQRFLGTDPTRAAPTRPMLAPIAAGGLVVVWSGAPDAVSASNLNAAFFDAQGVARGQKTLALPVGTSALPLADGGFLTAGFDGRFTGGGIVAQRYDPEGNALGDPIQLGGSLRTGGGLSSFLLKDGSPGLLFEHVDPIAGSTQQTHFTLLVLSAADGSRLHSLRVGDRFLAGFASSRLAGAALDDGGFAVMSSLWKPGVLPPETRVIVERFDASGQSQGQTTIESALVDGTPQPIHVPIAVAGATENSILIVTRAPAAAGATNVVGLHR